MIFLDDIWQRTLIPPDTREIYDWVAQEGELPSSYAMPGRFDPDSAPFIKEPLEALRSAAVREVVDMSSIQSLKTLEGEMWLAHSIANNPGATQWLQNTDEEAKEHAQERFLDFLLSFAPISRLYTENRHDKKTVFIKFKHMFLRMEGQNNIRNLQRKSIKNQMCSEVWQWKPGHLKEAAARLTQFTFNSKRFIESQPGVLSRDPDGNITGDDMYLAYLAGSQKVWNFKCYGCARYQPYLWTHLRADGTRAAMRWEDSARTRREGGVWRWGELVQTIRYECIHCGHKHYDEPLTRRRMSAEGKYFAQNPDAPFHVESFNRNQLCVPNLSWFETKIGGVRNFLFAHEQSKKGFDGLLREFFQKVMAEPWDPDKFAIFTRLPTIDVAASRQSADGRTTKWWDKQDYIFMAIDVQLTEFWYLIIAWSKTGEFMVLESGKLYAWEDLRARQQHYNVPDHHVAVDTSHRQYEVWYYCTLYGSWQMVGGKKVWLCWWGLRGSDEDSFPYRVKKGKTKGRVLMLPYKWPPQTGDPCLGLTGNDERRRNVYGRYCPVLTWSNPTVKDAAKNLRTFMAKGARGLVQPGPWNEEFSKQMYSETKKPIPNKLGQVTWKWEVIGKRPNHLWDCFCMIVTRAFMLRILGPVGEDKSEHGP
jgi:hypothetical protein